MAFQQGLSGLNASSKALDVISNNVANASNVGFKMSNTQYADVYAASLNGALGGVQVGIGTAIGQVAQSFTQGNITATNNALDVAINGAGFYRMSKDGAIAYSRNGQFEVDKSGYIVNAQGYRLTGYLADTTGTIVPSSPKDIYLNTADLQPKATTAIKMGLNLNSGNSIPINSTFSTTDSSSYNSSTSATVYDSLGNSHILSTYFAKTSSNNWDMYVALDGEVQGGAASPTAYGMTFSSTGGLTLSTGAVDANGKIAISGLTSASLTATGASTPISLSMDISAFTQYGSAFGVNSQSQDGYASGKLSGITIGQDGVIQGRYSNGQTNNLGQIVLANFANAQGLLALGSNLWAESPTSGQPLVGAPQTGNLGSLSAGSVEESNVDLTAELVSMITAQRNYQANAQSIKTQDQVMQTLVNLR